jgi:hypothetical protein
MDLLNLFLILLLFIYINIPKLEISGVQFKQGDHPSVNLKNSLLVFSLEKMRKEELIQTVKDLQSKPNLEKSNPRGLTFIELIKLFYKKIYFIYVSIFTFISKFAIGSLIFGLFSKFKIVRFI